MASATAETTSGRPGTGVENEIAKWNWGAFLWTAIWTLGHRLWWQSAVAILVGWIPLVGLGIAIWFALKGNRWAWERGSYSGTDDFRRRERRWVKAWFVVMGVVVALFVLVGLLG